jgi:hypothetical protein
MAQSKTAAKPARTVTRPGIYFLSLTVENVRCFGPAQTLDLSNGHGHHARWTVILGENGLGKTTLLSCLAYTADAGHTVRELFLAAGRDESGATLHRLSEWPSLPRRFIRPTGNSKISVLVVKENGVGKTEEMVLGVFGGSTFAKVLDEEFSALSVYKYGVNRQMPRRQNSADFDERVSTFLDDDVALRDPEGWLLTADHNARLHGPDAERFGGFAKRVQNALISILPDVADIQIQPSDEPGGSPRVEARTPDGWVPLRQLGFGYQSQIAWLVDFASRMFERHPDSPDPLAEPAVVLVDEIDLHMHPRWQRQVITYLTEICPNTQFIVTAHSPLVVQAAAGANIVLLRREGDHVVIDNDPEVLRNWRVDQILTSDLFGLDSARPPQVEAQLKERRALLAKPKLTSRDRGKLARLEAEIGDLPAGESAEDRRAMELIRRAAEKLQSNA